MSKRKTFERVENWIQETASCNAPVKILVGNKIDLVMTKKTPKGTNVTKSEGEALGKKYGIDYFEASSITEAAIQPLFNHLFDAMLSHIPNPPSPENLVGLNVSIGPRVTKDMTFLLALAESLPNYD